MPIARKQTAAPKHKTTSVRVGRPTKLTRALQKKICALLIKTDESLANCALACDITEETLRRWRVRGRKEKEGIYYEFYGEVKKAQAQCAIRDLERIDAAADGYRVVIHKKKHTTRRGGLFTKRLPSHNIAAIGPLPPGGASVRIMCIGAVRLR